MSRDEERFRRDEELLRHALRDEADRATPSPDALARIRRRTARPPMWRSPLMLGLAAAGVTAAAVIAGGVYVLGRSSDDTVASGSDSTSSAVASPTAPSPGPSDHETPTTPPDTTPTEQAGTAKVPVYYVTETPNGQRLAREFHTVETPNGPLVAAVATMLAQPADDPDYKSLWQPATTVRAVTVSDDVIEVDLTGSGDYSGVRNDVAVLATQQLVYTATAATAMSGANGSLPVQILVEGEPARGLWGELDLSQPVARAAQINVRQLVQINNPSEGAVVGRTVTIDGEAAAFEATIDWQVVQDDMVVETGFATTTAGQKFAPFEFTVELPPGSYEILVSGSDPSGGAEGPGPMSDSKNFTVE